MSSFLSSFVKYKFSFGYVCYFQLLKCWELLTVILTCGPHLFGHKAAWITSFRCSDFLGFIFATVSSLKAVFCYGHTPFFNTGKPVGPIFIFTFNCFTRKVSRVKVVSIWGLNPLFLFYQGPLLSVRCLCYFSCIESFCIASQGSHLFTKADCSTVETQSAS